MVAWAGIDAEGAQHTSAHITEAGKDSLAMHIDVADEDSVKTALGNCLDELGTLDVLFNNAAIGDATAGMKQSALTSVVFITAYYTELRLWPNAVAAQLSTRHPSSPSWVPRHHKSLTQPAREES